MSFLERLKYTLLLRLFALLKMPVLFFVGPRVVEVNAERCVVKIPLGWRTRNHLRSMYIGVLATGADCVGGLAAMKQIRESGANVSVLFKDLHADFLKRAESDVVFTCEDGPLIASQVARALEIPERVTFPIHVTATCPDTTGAEPVARFAMTLSMKRR